MKVLIEALARPWYMEPVAASLYADRIHRLLSGDASAFADKQPKEEDYAFAVSATGRRIGGIADAQDNGVAVIQLRGAVMKYDYCGAPGTQTLAKAIEQANDNPAISAIVLQIDSPGGSVAGTQSFANTIKNSKKPVVAYADGMMASAAMWIGSAASYRMASANTDVIGSIGTMASWSDAKGYREKMGIKDHEVYATASTDKNKAFREATTGNYEPLIKHHLDPLNDQFIAAIQANLPGASETVLSGNTYIATEAKKKGLIDGIGSFEMAVKKAITLANDKKTKQSNKMEVFQNTLQAAGAESFEVIEGGFLLTEENLNAIEANLSQAGSVAAAAQTAADATATQLAELQAQLATANEATAERDTTIANLNQQIETLKKGAAGTFPVPGAAADNLDTGHAAKFHTSVDEEAARLRALRSK